MISKIVNLMTVPLIQVEIQIQNMGGEKLFIRERCVTPTRLPGAKGDPRTRPRESPFLEHSFQDFIIARLRCI